MLSGLRMRDALDFVGLDELGEMWATDGPVARDARGNTLLHRLSEAHLGHQSSGIDDEQVRTELARRVVDAGCPVDAVRWGFPVATALSAAAMLRDAAFLRLLVSLGADPNAPAERPPLVAALEMYDPARRMTNVEALISVGASLGQPATLAAIIGKGDMVLLRRAIAAAATLDVLVGGNPLLAVACEGGRVEVVELLLKAGASPNIRGEDGRTPLHFVRDTAVFDILTAHGADVRATRNDGEGIIAAYVRLCLRDRRQSEELVRRAVCAGARINGRAEQRRTPLHTLADFCHTPQRCGPVVEMIDLLLELGANRHALTSDGLSPLDVATAAPVIEALENAGTTHGSETIGQLSGAITAADLEHEPIWEAVRVLAETGRGDDLLPLASKLRQAVLALEDDLAAAFAAYPPTSLAVLQLLSAGPCGTDECGRSVLHLALTEDTTRIKGGDRAKVAAVFALLEAGADPNSVDVFGRAPLCEYLDHVSSWSHPDQHTEMIGRLASSVTIDTPEHRPSLSIAADLSQTVPRGDLSLAKQVVRQLVDAGADLSIPANFAALCRGGFVSLVKQAVRSGADPAAVRGGRTALHEAVEADQVAVVRYLLELGVNPNAGSPKRTPLFGVCSVEVLDLLLSAGADPHVAHARDGSTPLHAIAANWRIDGRTMVELVHRFERLGVSRNAPNKTGNTPVLLMQTRQAPEIRSLVD